jgi:antibiotic biosynthesis monooxygenase (ABM) superfamily enzyme
MKNKKKALPAPYAELTKDARFAGTYEVLVPVEGRNKPHRVPLQFDTLESAEGWIHSPEGKDVIQEIVTGKRT